MSLSTSYWMLIFTILASHNQISKADDEYTKFYSNIIKSNGESSSFITKSLWDGAEIMIYKDDECSSGIKEYKLGVEREEEWALKMLDSSTHLQSGFLHGNVVDLGNTDECLKIENEKKTFKGKMCYVVFMMRKYESSMISDKYRTTVSVCVPSKCEENDVRIILSNGLPFQTSFYVGDCVTEEKFSPPYSDAEYYIITFFIILLTIISISTVYDILQKESSYDKEDETTLKNKKDVPKCKAILLSFSLYSNGKALFQEDTRIESIKVLHGLRFFAACGVLCVHRHILDPQSFTNMSMFNQEMRKWYRMIQFNSYIWVDVFFLMSGLLISYNFLLKKEPKKRLNIWKYYLHRYIRLTPTLAAVILISLLSDQMCYGPHCGYLNRLFKRTCEKNWWATLTYVNNMYDQFEMCIIQSWYLSADMQMFWLSPILLYTLIIWPRLIFMQLLLLFATTTTYVYFISYSLGLPPTFIGTEEYFKNDSMYIYNQFFGRAGPWLIGFGLGILMQRHNEEPVKMSKFSVTVGWIRSVVFCAVAMFGMTPFVQENHERQPVIESLFKAFYRNIWASGFAWIIYACYTGYGGWVNTFLSSYWFHPISRLSYSFYLIHIFGQFLLFQTAHVPRRYSDITQLATLISDVVIGMILAIILNLTIEAPTLNLEKVLWNRKAVEIEESKLTKLRTVKEA